MKISNFKFKISNFFGFTLVELLITITIIFLLSGISLAYYNNFSEQTKLKNESKKLIDILELAKKKAQATDLYTSCSSFDGYQVNIQPTNYSLSFCCNGACNVTVQTFNFPNNITVNSGVGVVQFKPKSSGTSLTSDQTVKIKNTTIESCINTTVSKIGVITIDDNLTSCP